jgi:hypothetical protein
MLFVGVADDADFHRDHGGGLVVVQKVLRIGLMDEWIFGWVGEKRQGSPLVDSFCNSVSVAWCEWFSRKHQDRVPAIEGQFAACNCF